MSTPISTPARKRGTLGLHLRQARIEVALFHLEVGDAVAEQTADAVVPLEDGDGVAARVSCCAAASPAGPGPDDGNGLAREALGRDAARPSRSARRAR